MKICKRGLEYVQTWEDGTVKACSWTGVTLGNLLSEDMYDIYHGDVAEEFRKSLMDGSYRFCSAERCPWLSNGTIEDHIVEVDEVPMYPKELSLSHELDCNYVCTCCRDKIHIKSECEKNNVKVIESKLSDFIDDVTTISANGKGELFASKSILKLLENWTPKVPKEDVKVVLETNGSLFDEKHWRQIEHLGEYNLEVAITIHSFEESTYQYLSGTNMSIEKLCDNLRFVRKLREEGVINYLELATVVQESNFRSLPRFVERCIDEFGADKVRIRPYFMYGCKPKYIEWIADVRNPYHPHYPEYEKIMHHSIFKHPKVYKWSNEMLSTAGEHPYVRVEQYYNWISKLELSDISELRSKWFDILNDKKFAIYGAGNIGKIFAKYLCEADLQPWCFIDKSEGLSSYMNISMKTIDDVGMDIDTIIVSPMFQYEKIEHLLRLKGFQGDIYSIEDMI